MLMVAKKDARFEPTERSQLWDARAGDLLNEALYQLRFGEDPIPAVSAALAALKIAVGELDATELAFMFEEDGRPCICPPELLQRGGFVGNCPAHASC